MRDLTPFMPHPMRWQLSGNDRKLDISRGTAVEVLGSLGWMDKGVKRIMDEWLQEINAIARGE